jgi:hypothetical protein
MVREVRSPWSRERGETHPRLAESPGAYSNPSNPLHHVGKGGSRTVPLSRRDSTPVVGGNRTPFSDLERR